MANSLKTASYFSAMLPVLILMSDGAVAQPNSDRVPPFRSELWRMEFRDEDDGGKTADPNHPHEDPEQGEEPKARGTRFDPADDVTVSAGEAEASDSYDMPLPGDVDLPQLRHETPLADWRVDAAADGEIQGFRSEPTAWELSRITRFGSVSAVDGASGPTATTFAVAIVACIVVTGALFSGRE